MVKNSANNNDKKNNNCKTGKPEKNHRHKHAQTNKILKKRKKNADRIS